MGTTKNIVLAVSATALLISGFLLLVPEPVEAIKAQAPQVVVSDRENNNDGKLQTRLTTTVLIPQGEVIPVTGVDIRMVHDGPVTFTNGQMGAGSGATLVTCTGSILSISGASLSTSPRRLQGYGYDIGANSNGYGYDFTTRRPLEDFSTFNTGYGAGNGYGYGSDAADTTLTVSALAYDCPAVSHFSASTIKQFTFQVVLQARDANGNGASFYSLPTTSNIRNPEASFGTAGSANTDTSPSATTDMQTLVQDGQVTTFSFTMFPGGGSGDAFTFMSGTMGPFNAPPGTAAQTFTFLFQQPAPEGSSIGISFYDQVTNGGAVSGAPFNINPTALATQLAGTTAYGFFSVQMNGLDPANTLADTASEVLKITVVLDVPTTFFTSNGLSATNFHLARFSDAGAFQNNVFCSLTTPRAGFQTFSCEMDDFSSFAMVASAISSGGGGGSTTTTTTSSTVTTTSTSTVTTTSTDTSTSTVTTTGSDTGSSTKGKGKGGSAPGLEFGLLVGALAGIALLARRKLK